MEKHKQASSHWLFIIYFLGCAIVIALLWPSVMSAHRSMVEARIHAARGYEQAGDLRKAENQYAIANTIRMSYQQPTKDLAAFYAREGRYEEAIATIKQLPFSSAYDTQITYEMNYQKWESAQNDLMRAIKANPSSDNYAKLAIAQYNLEKIEEGCNSAATATKKGLDNPTAAEAVRTCQLVKEKLTRENAYKLIRVSVLSQPEKYLDTQSSGNATDLLLLAQLASGRGDNKLALERVEKAAKLDPTNESINTLAAKLSSALGEREKAASYLYRSNYLKRIEQY